MQNLGHRRSQAVHIPVNVQFTIVWKVIVDNQRHLLDINTSGPHICWYQHSTEAETEQHGMSEMGKMAASNQELLSTLQINVNLKTKAAFKAISWRKKLLFAHPGWFVLGKTVHLVLSMAWVVGWGLHSRPWAQFFPQGSSQTANNIFVLAQQSHHFHWPKNSPNNTILSEKLNLKPYHYLICYNTHREG